MNKNLGVALVVIFVIATIGAYLFPKAQVPQEPLGATPGPQSDAHQYFLGGSTDGGRAATTSTARTYTLNAKDVAGLPTYIDWFPTNGITISLSATSTFDYVPNIGDVAVIYIRNASTTAAADLTIAAVDSGVDLQKNEDVADLTVLGLDWARLTLIRESLHLTTVLFDELTEAD